MQELDYRNFLIESARAESILFEHYGLQGKASPLPGEYDMNFRIDIEGKDQYILKIARPDTDTETLDFQQKLLIHLEQSHTGITAPVVIPDKMGNFLSSFKDNFNRHRPLRLLSWIPGRIYQQVIPKRDDLRLSLGQCIGKLTASLESFDHPKAHRIFEWDLANSLWTANHIDVFKKQDKEIVTFFQERFSDRQNGYKALPKSVIHNDANDHNLIVDHNLKDPKVLAVIDYGDAIYSQTINDLAVTCAYGIMEQNDPLSAALSIVTGFNQSRKLREEELEYLYDCIAMRLVITVTKSALNKIAEPDNVYLQVSEKPAWEVLKKWKEISADFACYSFRQACGYTAHPKEEEFKAWASKVKIGLDQLFPTEKTNDCIDIDLSVSSKWLGHLSEFADFDLFEFKINQLQKKYPHSIIAGGYLEPRLVYSTEAYQKKGNERRESRTIHLGIDFWLPAGTPVHAPLKGEVVLAVNDAGDKEYGGLIILKHKVEDLTFFSLYGHLSVKSATSRLAGEIIEAGALVGLLGNYPENGNWAPHLHFEIMLSMLDFHKDFPGVAYRGEIETWKSICPDPNLLFKLEHLEKGILPDNKQLKAFRAAHLGKGMSLSYQEPLQMVRGMGAYLVDQFGTAYLDTVNNVAHVGHEHHAVVKAGQDQMALLNTNTRYLHENINLLAKELLDTFPPELSVVHFVNSGSEANELALRMAKIVTKNKDILASEMGYHGNTNACIEVSSYKFDSKGGKGCPEHTQLFPLPDQFRGQHRGENAGLAYAQELEKTISALKKKDRLPAALILEPIISCGGQIELPTGFLAKAYEHTRKAGGLCISDEVQVGCGRIGSSFWGFQLHNVIPDIVTIGKPLGNGHPVAAVVCTREVADKFANGMEYFNTFGGNPVSCAIAREVLKTVKRESLQSNALTIGNFLKTELKKLAKTFPILKDIRGQGLFLGVELTDEHLLPLPEQTHYLANRMKDKGILMSVDGPDHNVLKIKPPLVFSKENAIQLIDALTSVLKENYMTTK